MSVNVFAAETREYKRVSATEATVTIKTEETDYTQAAMYTDSKENDVFIKALLKDAKSPLYKLAREIEFKNCETNSTPEETYIDGCGEVTITAAVRTEYGRGGWQNASAGYTFFVGFTDAGTGRFFGVSHMVKFSEESDAQTTENGDYSGIVLKTLSLGKIVKISDESTENNEKM
jgi:hypothetical protein